MHSSGVFPPTSFSNSSAQSLIIRGMSSPIASRTAWIVSTIKVHRPSMSPPYLSVRRFVYDERKLDIRYPTIPDISIIWKPASIPRRAASACS